ncbi:uncharacterized membrane protein (UPF0182 family) [Desulfofundulus luciae]|uniref:UPF0182 protein J2Z49_002775 n=1 Tax=Desulfofundulus luciae TaxID=74702 RepID=A0ABU0B4K5_9FIRM|nr:UPF0182 family protein [Desulfofundulus luciae]MDQ0287645.1 uncharacterized membrane protein (UPF0182 family) [Desulfofundulus luciae]
MGIALRLSKTLLILGLFIILALIYWGAGFYTNWLWFKSLNFEKVFLTILLSQWVVGLVAGLTVFLVFFVNLLFTRGPLIKAAETRPISNGDIVTLYQPPWGRYVQSRKLTAVMAILSLIPAFLTALAVTDNWMIVQQFLHSTPFNLKDPIFHRDVGFYVFQLPFYHFIYRLLLWTSVLSLLAVSGIYALIGGTAQNGWKSIFRFEQAKYHLSGLAAAFFLLRAWGYRLDQYMLLYSGRGVVYGPGYTDIHANLLAYKVLFVLALACTGIILLNIFLSRFRLVLYTIGFLVVGSIVLGSIYPAAVQKFIVVPNEMNREKPYIENAIKFTRLAYKLDSIERKSFPAGRELTAQDLKNNQDTINNIRLWDYRPLQQTYSQLQEMRLYYQLKNIDIDRYIIDGRYRQVMVAARELNQSQLPPQAQTWVNLHLKYTHGYGIVMSPVNEVTREGLPRFLIKDIPPATHTDLKIERPEIYFGEVTDNYVIVNTKSPEFDYPKGDENAWSTYQGNKGVKVGSLGRRLLFAISFGDYRLFLSGDITNESQVLYYRNIYERVPKLVPFLTYDRDPYIVLANGKLYWMWDAYTTTNMFPCAEPYNHRLNYIRNAVKVVVDAYDGSVDFYIADKDDPIIQTYSKIFPGVFRPLAEMPEALRAHTRYPEDLFMIQAQKYAIYHMEDYRIFYNKEDKWDRPTEIVEDKEELMEAYYIITRLPGEKEPEYIQILPFIPQNKKNMVAWLAGRSDGPNYGRLLVYEFPKQELVYGPMQIEARINQDTTISQQLSLWDQRGSRVFRGNLLVIPVKDSLLYVEPLYLQAEQSKMPELRRVIVVHGDQVVMEPTLEEALKRIFSEGKGETGQTTPGAQPATGDQSVAELAREASRLYDQAMEKLRGGDWAGYGESLQQLKRVINELTERTNE